MKALGEALHREKYPFKPNVSSSSSSRGHKHGAGEGEEEDQDPGDSEDDEGIVYSYIYSIYSICTVNTVI